MNTWNRDPNPQTSEYCARVAIHGPVIANQTLGFPFISSKTSTIPLSLLETLYSLQIFQPFFYKNLTLILKNSSCPELLNLIWIVLLCLMLLNLFWYFSFSFVLVCVVGIKLCDSGLGIVLSGLKLWLRCWRCDWGLCYWTISCEIMLDALSKRSSLSGNSYPPQLLVAKS